MCHYTFTNNIGSVGCDEMSALVYIYLMSAFVNYWCISFHKEFVIGALAENGSPSSAPVIERRVFCNVWWSREAFQPFSGKNFLDGENWGYECKTKEDQSLYWGSKLDLIFLPIKRETKGTKPEPFWYCLPRFNTWFWVERLFFQESSSDPSQKGCISDGFADLQKDKVWLEKL